MNRAYPLLLDDAQVNGAFSSHFKEPRMCSSVVQSVLRRQRDMIAGCAGSFLPLMAVRLAGHMSYGLQHGEVGSCLIAAPEGRNIALKASLELKTERRGDDHVACRFVFAGMQMSRIQIERKEDGMWKGGTQSLDDEKGIIGIGTHDPNGPGALSFIMNASDECLDVICLAGPFVPVSRGFLRLIGGLGGTRRSGGVVSRDFSIQSSEVAVSEHVEGEGFIIGGTLDLEIDRLRHRLAPLLDTDRHLNRLEILLGKGGHLGTGCRTKLDWQSPPVE